MPGKKACQLLTLLPPDFYPDQTKEAIVNIALYEGTVLYRYLLCCLKEYSNRKINEKGGIFNKYDKVRNGILFSFSSCKVNMVEECD